MESNAGPVRLRPQTSPVTKFVVTTLVCVFWNGVVWAVIGNFWLVSRQHSEPLSLFVLLFFVPFTIVGLLMAAFAVYQFLALFNPRPHLTLSHPVLVPGQPTELRWRFHTDPRRIERLQFWLEGAEVQVHGHGKERRIERKQFAKIDLADVTRFTEAAAGRLEIRLPPDVRPSQALSQPQIEWRLRMRAHIARHLLRHVGLPSARRTTLSWRRPAKAPHGSTVVPIK